MGKTILESNFIDALGIKRWISRIENAEDPDQALDGLKACLVGRIRRQAAVTVLEVGDTASIHGNMLAQRLRKYSAFYIDQVIRAFVTESNECLEVVVWTLAYLSETDASSIAVVDLLLSLPLQTMFDQISTVALTEACNANYRFAEFFRDHLLQLGTPYLPCQQ